MNVKDLVKSNRIKRMKAPRISSYVCSWCKKVSFTLDHHTQLSGMCSRSCSMTKRNTGKFGKDHPRYVGNFTTYCDGYVRKFDRNGSIYQHRQVVEKVLNRKLTKKEVVHHINFQKDCNNPNNLIVVSSAENAAFNAKIAKRLATLVPQELLHQITLEELGCE